MYQVIDNNRWILIEEGLPSIGENVFVVTEYMKNGVDASDAFYGYMDEYGGIVYAARRG
jgi:hypothetical protein